MKKKIGLLIFTTLFLNMTWADSETIHNQLKTRYPNLELSHIQQTEMPRIYSAQLDGQVVYIGEDAEYILVGSMIRLKDQKNLTKDLLLAQNQINWSQLPLDDAIKIVKGNGKHNLAVFSDPNCPYCQKLEAELDQLQNVTIYTFMYPLRTQSLKVSKEIWCEANRGQAWKNFIRNKTQPKEQRCNNPIERNLKLGHDLGFNATPTLIFSNGYVVKGLIEAKNIELIWNEFGL